MSSIPNRAEETAEPRRAGSLAPSVRIPMVDLARGLALLAMTLFHFIWDLGMFGLVDPAVPFSTPMVWFARAIAGSFLFLVGVSLFLAHREKIRWPNFLNRLAFIAGAAALVTVATYFATPEAFIFFGILHSIALSSVLGLAFLRLPAWLTLLAAAFFLLGGDMFASEAFNAPLFWWTGLSAVEPVANDYVPLFPFFGMVLVGIGAARIACGFELDRRLATVRADSPPERLLRFIGRNSLVYYLLHQPVMIGTMAGILWLTGNI